MTEVGSNELGARLANEYRARCFSVKKKSALTHFQPGLTTFCPFISGQLFFFFFDDSFSTSISAGFSWDTVSVPNRLHVSRAGFDGIVFPLGHGITWRCPGIPAPVLISGHRKLDVRSCNALNAPETACRPIPQFAVRTCCFLAFRVEIADRVFEAKLPGRACSWTTLPTRNRRNGYVFRCRPCTTPGTQLFREAPERPHPLVPS